jgi:hypothetical protein
MAFPLRRKGVSSRLEAHTESRQEELAEAFLPERRDSRLAKCDVRLFLDGLPDLFQR